MRSTFRRNLSADEIAVLQQAFDEIITRCNYLIQFPTEAYDVFHTTTCYQQRQVIGALDWMTFICCGNYQIATKFHPFSWANLWFYAPLIRNKSILLPEKLFDHYQILKETVIRKFSYIQLCTVDGKMSKGEISYDFNELISDAWVWTFLLS